MIGLTGIAARSAWNRRFALSLVILCIALSTFLLLSIERVRKDSRAHFAASVSGTDLIVGPRAGSLQLLLYSVFRIGDPANNISSASVEELRRRPAVAWVVPISLGDSHRGFPVVATTDEYFRAFVTARPGTLVIREGRPFGAGLEAVVGDEVARRAGYRRGDRIVLAHGDGALAENDHTDKPFIVVGILERTGTPVDRSVHIGLTSMEALHRDWIAGSPLPGGVAPLGQPVGTPRSVTAALVGLKNRSAVFAVQRWVADYRAEPLQALLPGVALDELWSIVDIAEAGLVAMGALVSVVGIAGMVAVILAGLNERRRRARHPACGGCGPTPDSGAACAGRRAGDCLRRRAWRCGLRRSRGASSWMVPVAVRHPPSCGGALDGRMDRDRSTARRGADRKPAAGNARLSPVARRRALAKDLTDESNQTICPIRPSALPRRRIRGRCRRRCRRARAAVVGVDTEGMESASGAPKGESRRQRFPGGHGSDARHLGQGADESGGGGRSGAPARIRRAARHPARRHQGVSVWCRISGPASTRRRRPPTRS